MPNRTKRMLLWGAALILMLTGCGGRRTEAASSSPSPTVAVQEKLQITKYPGNYTSFKLETSQGVTIITDPFAMDEDVPADIVTTSHAHGDHADVSRIQEPYRLIHTAGTFTEKGISITGVAGHHNKGLNAIPNIIYVFEIDGIRLAQFASQAEVPTDAMFAEIGNVDILIIQIYGSQVSKLSAEEASEIARRLQAKIVIPAHTDISQNDTLASLLTRGERMGETAEKIDGGRLTVTRAELAAQRTPRVIVLDRPEE